VAFLDEAFIEAMISDEVQEALYGDDSGDVFLSAHTAAADALVTSALLNAGYGEPTLAANPKSFALVRLAAFGEFIALAYGRKQLEVPDEYSSAVKLRKQIQDGDLPMPDMQPSAPTAVGGVDFTESDPSVESDEVAPQIFSRRALDST